MLELCIFDLDDTLVRTSDLKEIREAGKGIDTPEYANALKASIGDISGRILYSMEGLKKIKVALPASKIGVFTRAPRSYAITMLQTAYPDFPWDFLVAFEDVKPTKPYGDGIRMIMAHFGIAGLNRVVLIGDNDADVRSAYNAGCFAGLDRSNWARQWSEWEWSQWHALELIPDAIFKAPDEMLEFLKAPFDFLPELERSLEGGARRGSPRFDEIGHFIHRSIEGDHSRCPIHIAGRFFASKDSTTERRNWHKLTNSITNNKESDQFPDSWIETVRAFVQTKYMFYGQEIKITVVPHRPGRKPRLEHLLTQLAASFQAKPIGKLKVSFHPELFAYRDGVKSQHSDQLGQIERFTNVRDHLYVHQPEIVTPNAAFLVIDDVTTTGASLVYSKQYLSAAGATDVRCLSMAKNVGNLYYEK